MNIIQITALAKEYDNAFNARNQRLNIWSTQAFHLVEQTLVKIKDALISNVDFFKHNLYLSGDKNVPIEGVGLRSGAQTIGEVTEVGFHIIFVPSIFTGKIIIAVSNHHIKDEEQETFNNVDYIEPEDLTEDKICRLVYSAMEIAQKSSFLFHED